MKQFIEVPDMDKCIPVRFGGKSATHLLHNGQQIRQFLHRLSPFTVSGFIFCHGRHILVKWRAGSLLFINGRERDNESDRSTPVIRRWGRGGDQEPR